MPTAVMVPTARPTFVVDVAQERADAARALLIELGADVSGPTHLVMNDDDVAAAKPAIDPDADLVACRL